MGGTCYGVRATLLVGLVTDEKALYTGSTSGQAVGAGGQSWVSSALYSSVRPAGRRNVRCCVLSECLLARSVLRMSVASG